MDTYEPYQPGLLANGWAGVVIGPGPGTERSSPHLMQYVADAVAAGIPLLGICLGMQALGTYFGAKLVQAPVPIHGKVRPLVPVEGSRLYPDGPEEVVRYHSLALADLPPCLVAEAYGPDGVCMALRHSTLPIWAVQYHPEAACTAGGISFLHRWLRFAHVGSLPLPLDARLPALPLRKQAIFSLPPQVIR